MKTQKKYGFYMTEKMVGHFSRVYSDWGTDNWVPMKFNATWGTEDISGVMSEEGNFKFLLTGDITIKGLCRGAPLCGWLFLNYLTDGMLKYTFNFEANHRQLTFVGRKVNINPWNILTSHTTCVGAVYALEGSLMGHSVTYFQLRDVLRFLASFRPKITKICKRK